MPAATMQIIQIPNTCPNRKGLKYTENTSTADLITVFTIYAHIKMDIA